MVEWLFLFASKLVSKVYAKKRSLKDRKQTNKNEGKKKNESEQKKKGPNGEWPQNQVEFN